MPRPAVRIVYLAARVIQMLVWGAAAFLFFLLRLVVGIWPDHTRRGRAMNQALGMALRFMFERLGATFIKMGQIMSTRPDLLPPEIVGELVKLQEQVRPFSARVAQRIVEEQLGCPLKELFESFDETPVAAASVAQVHRARIKGEGDEVAVKIRRPAIGLWTDLDQSIILGVAHLLRLIPSARLLAPVEVARRFCNAINRQLDFRIEAANNDRFRRNFALEPAVVFPRLYPRLCSEFVLTMEYLHGCRVSDLDQEKINPHKVAGLGIRVFCKMAFIDGFVHGDLHPGNIRFLPGDRIAIFDLGLTAELSEEDRLMFAQTMFYMVHGMGRELARHMYGLCLRVREIDYQAYEHEIITYIEQFINRPLGEIEMSLAIGSFLDIFRRYGMRLDGRYTMLNISMLVVEGIGKKLDPALDITAAARPYLEAALSPLMKSKSAPPAGTFVAS